MTLDKTAKVKVIMIEFLKYFILCFFAFWTFIISRKSGQKIQKIANLQYYKSKANYGTKKKGISR